MSKISYEDKINFLEGRREHLIRFIKMLKKFNKSNSRIQDYQKQLDIIECIIKDIRKKG